MLLAYFVCVIVMSAFGIYAAWDTIPFAETKPARIAAWVAFIIAVVMCVWSIYLAVVIG